MTDERTNGDSPKVSIIIPCYNVEKYLVETLESVKAQTFADYEVLLINDGSQDHTIDIIEEYCKSDFRFHVYTQKNQGVSAARNRGMDLARGDYVAFYDADDFIPKWALENMVMAAELEFADLVIGRYRIRNVSGTKMVKSSIRLSNKRTIRRFDPDMLWAFSVCNKLFRRAAIEKLHLRFRTDLKITEDGLFLIQFAHNCGKITGAPVIAYEYRRRPFWEEASATQMASLQQLKYSHQTFQLLEKRILEDTKMEVSSEEHMDGDYAQAIKDRLIYRSTFYNRFVRSDFLADYYRKLWLSDTDLSTELEIHLEYCRQQMFPDMWEKILEQNPELRLHEGVMTRKKAAERPFVTIYLKRTLMEDEVNGILNSCYKQEMPFFEILADGELEPRVTETYKAKENFHFRKIERRLSEQVKGEFIIILDEELWFTENTLNELLSVFWERPQLQSILIPIMELKQGKMVAARCYSCKAGDVFKSPKMFRTPFLAYRKKGAVDWIEGQPEEGKGFMMKKPEGFK